MLQIIKLLRLRNSEFIQFFFDFIKIILRHKPEELGVKEQLNPVVEEFEKVKSLYGAGQGSRISKDLEDIDGDRDSCINGIHGVIDAYTNHYDDEVKAAANLLLDKIENYGPSIAKQNYQAETISLTGLTEAFSSEPTYIEALAKISLTEWVGQMKSKNDFFNDRYHDRVDEIAVQSNDKIKELRKTITTNYYTLRDHLNAHSTLKGEAFKIVMAKLNELITEYNLVIKKRQGSTNGEEEK